MGGIPSVLPACHRQLWPDRPLSLLIFRMSKDHASRYKRHSSRKPRRREPCKRPWTCNLHETVMTACGRTHARLRKEFAKLHLRFRTRVALLIRIGDKAVHNQPRWVAVRADTVKLDVATVCSLRKLWFCIAPCCDVSLGRLGRNRQWIT